MNIRKDSPFYGITNVQIEQMLQSASEGFIADAAVYWEEETGKDVHVDQVRRFLVRARQHRRLLDAQEAVEDMSDLVERGKGGRTRDGVIEAARLKLLEEAMEKGDSKTLLELYKAANQEKALENQAEVERRKAAVAEENAKIGWRKLELKRAEAALRLLPKLRVLLEEGGGTAEEKLARVKEVLGMPLYLQEQASGGSSA